LAYGFLGFPDVFLEVFLKEALGAGLVPDVPSSLAEDRGKTRTPKRVSRGAIGVGIRGFWVQGVAGLQLRKFAVLFGQEMGGWR
jgi:hypothetical protein